MKSKLLSKKLPVIIHRWFPDGESWAYHASLNNRVIEVIYSLDKVLKNCKMGRFKVKVSDNQWIICLKRPDMTTKDKKAINRGPFYLTAAVIDGPEPTDEELTEIYQHIKTLPEVEEPGSNENLTVGDKN